MSNNESFFKDDAANSVVVITDDMIERTCIELCWQMMLRSGTPAEDLEGLTAQSNWDDAGDDGDETFTKAEMRDCVRLALKAALQQ